MKRIYKNSAIVAVVVLATFFSTSAPVVAETSSESFEILVDGEEFSTDVMKMRVPSPPKIVFKVSVKSTKNPKVYGNFSFFVDGQSKIRLDRASFSAVLRVRPLKERSTVGSWAIYTGPKDNKNIILLFDVVEKEYLQFVKIAE